MRNAHNLPHWVQVALRSSNIDDPNVIDPPSQDCAHSAYSGAVTIRGWQKSKGIMQGQNVIMYVELHSDSRELVKLLADWSSCVRFAYGLFRQGKSFRSIQFAAKAKYVTLNRRYIFPALKDAHRKHKRTENQVPIIFGGKELYAKFCAGKISVKEWRFMRDGMMFVKADLTKTENPGLLIKNTEAGFHLEVFIGNTGFINRDIRTFPLSVPKRVYTRLSGLLASGVAYNVRLHRKQVNKYKVTVDCETND